MKMNNIFWSNAEKYDKRSEKYNKCSFLVQSGEISVLLLIISPNHSE